MIRLWVLYLVPGWPQGRWLAGFATFLIMAGVLFGTGEFVSDAGDFAGYIPLFFCVIVAYIVPVFHFITTQTGGGDGLQPFSPLKPLVFHDGSLPR